MFIQPVIVIYNKECTDSISVDALLNQGISPIIIDNSTINNKNEEFCRNNSIIYISMRGNAGLSKAYNKALTIISKNVEFVLWLDDDTVLPDNYISNLEKAVRNNDKYKVYIPIVKAENEKKGLLSPSIFQNMYTRRIKTIGEIQNYRFSAINSGMLVDRSIYYNYTYDENLFLDCIDHDFMNYCWNNNISIEILENIILFQNFSGDEKGSKKNKLKRYKIFSKDFRYFRNKVDASWIYTEAILMKRLVSILFK